MAADHSTYKPGDPPPGGYLNWHAWAEVQSKAGLEQVQCDRCHLWRFPQELAVISGTDNTCLQCADGVRRPAVIKKCRGGRTEHLMEPEWEGRSYAFMKCRWCGKREAV